MFGFIILVSNELCLLHWSDVPDEGLIYGQSWYSAMQDMYPFLYMH